MTTHPPPELVLLLTEASAVGPLPSPVGITSEDLARMSIEASEADSGTRHHDAHTSITWEDR